MEWKRQLIRFRLQQLDSCQNLSCGIRGTSVLQNAKQSFNCMLLIPDWRYRHAAIMAVYAVAKGKLVFLCKGNSVVTLIFFKKGNGFPYHENYKYPQNSLGFAQVHPIRQMECYWPNF